MNKWFQGQESPAPPPPPPCTQVLKHNLPHVEDSCADPGQEFWARFPTNPLPQKPTTVINVQAFEQAIKGVSHLLSPPEAELAQRVISDLRHGADTLVDQERVPRTTVGNGRMKTSSLNNCADQLATMVKDRIISGPFISPPVDGFRTNPLFVIERNNKTRTILDLSSPTGESYNEAIDENAIPIIAMSSPREIADLLVEYGPSAYFSKLDHKAAFKLVPVRTDIIALQGFQFLGRFFVETQLVFGSRSSPAIYDRLHEIFLLVAQLRAGVESRGLMRTLDDFVPVTPDKESNERIVNAYVALANEISLPLAPLDNPEKAFLVKQQGVLLGIDFDARNSRWRLPLEKANRHRRVFHEAGGKPSISCLDAERMLGMTQSVTSMIPVLRPLTFPLLEAVQTAKRDGCAPMTPTLRLATIKWLSIYHDLLDWRAISQPLANAPLTSPAIGIFEIKDEAKRHVGVAIEGNLPGRIIWPDCLRRKVFYAMRDKIDFPLIFLLTVGLLCAVWRSSRYIRGSHFTCYIDSPILANILRKGRDKRCKRTTMVIEAVFLSLINLDAFPTFELRGRATSPDAPEVEIPAVIQTWLRNLRTSAPLAVYTVKEMSKEGRISSLEEN